MPVIRHFVKRNVREQWRTCRLFRLHYYIGFHILGSAECHAICAAYSLHLARVPFLTLFSWLMGRKP